LLPDILVDYADVMTDCERPLRPKVEVEKLVKQNGGKIFHSELAHEHMIILADKGDLIPVY
jgi:hypothetical protein